MVVRIVLVKDSSNTHPNAWDIDKHKESKGLGVSLRLNRTPNQTLHPAPTLRFISHLFHYASRKVLKNKLVWQKMG